MRYFSAILLALSATVAMAATLSSTLTWTAPTGNTDGTAVSGTLTYNLYEGPSATALSASPAQTGITTLGEATALGAAPGATACFAVTAVEGGQESAQSNVSCKTFPASIPNAPILGVVQ